MKGESDMEILDEITKLTKGIFLNITERKIKRTCTLCNKEYEDTQIIINGIPSYRFNICPECIKSGKNVTALKGSKNKKKDE